MKTKQLHGIVVQNPFNMGYLGVRTMVEVAARHKRRTNESIPVSRW